MAVALLAAVFARRRRTARRDARGLVIQLPPSGNCSSTTHRSPVRSPQVRTRCFRAQAPHLPWVPYRWALLSCASSPRLPRPSMQFLSVASHVCSPASSRHILTDLPLPSASGYHGFIMIPCRHSHRGLPPHYIAPMLGAHIAVKAAPSGRWTLRDKAPRSAPYLQR